MNKNEWYAARTIYRHNTGRKRTRSKLYEERVVLIKANSFDDAISKAEEEATNYAALNTGVKYLGYVSVFKLFDGKVNHNTEIYSLMRESGLAENDYIDQFFDTGKERTKHTG